MLKMRIFGKTVKTAPASGALPPNHRLLQFRKEHNYYSKFSAFASSGLLHLFFTSNSVVLLTEAQKYFLPQGAGYRRH